MNEHTTAASQEGAQPAFFPVSPLKLFVLSIATLGLYELYWFYQNWKLIRHRTRRDILPFWRTFFAYFFCYSLFREMKELATSHGISATFSSGWLACGWVGLAMCWKLPDPYWLVTYMAVLALLPIQKTVNDLNAALAPNHERNSRFSGWNIAGVVAGGIMFVFVIIGAFTAG